MRALRAKLAVRLAALQAGTAAGSRAALGSSAKAWLVLTAALAALAGLQQRFPAAPEHAAVAVQPHLATAPSVPPRSEPPPALPVPIETPMTASVTTPSVPAPRARRGHDARVRTRNASTPPTEVDTDAEVALISSAQQVLEHDPRAALVSLDEHARRFTHGVLAEEREVFASTTRRDRPSREARMLARAFVTSFPKSAQRTRLRRWLDARSDAALVRNPDTEHTPTDRVRNTEEVE